ncbi:enoyl-CoA hydratase-related protein [Salipiger sp. P9]|uniref:enoyl-CoA hydratase/isomerase family protein n=1 Tax=Salipiger pentaromativorans TaxID=2943193 RepID=UPI00215720AB|nr:enoyl-CoA hydratase-related protein [Salipiger pentaromativorans]MCR8547584.1 enoyl-CoA hydratase-related protein [Salipiger pentaromativorans]
MKLPEEIKYEKDGPVAIVTFDRPKVNNSLTPDMMAGLNAAFDDFNRDDSLRVAILTGAGDKAFCAGADLEQTIPIMASGNFDQLMGDPSKRFFSDVFKPIIGAVNGFCVAGGMEILQGTDLRIASENAVFGLGEVRWGLVPGGGSHVRLPRQIPWAVAMEMILTGHPISAERAYQIGMINKIVPQEDLMTEARKLADVICQNGPMAVQTAKEIVVRSFALEAPFAFESHLTKKVFASNDAKEGPRAFMEKRKPVYSGN